MLRWGIVQEVRVDPPAVRVYFPVDDVNSGWLQVLSVAALGAKVYALPRPETLVAVLLGEDPSEGVVVGCSYNAKDKAPGGATVHALVVELEDGTRLVMDPDVSLVQLKTPGKVSVEASEIDIKGATKITGDVEIAGKVKITGDMDITGNGKVTGDWLNTGKNSGHHTHPVVLVPSPQALVSPT